jgi:hypothetical protein
MLAVLVADAIAAGLFLWEGDSDRATHRFAVLAALGLLLLITLLLHFVGDDVGGIVMGKDNRVSTSRLQALMWTYVVGFVLLAVVIAKWAGVGAGYKELLHGPIRWDYLVLLGGPFAAAVSARAIVGNKVDTGRISKPAAAPAKGKKKAAQAFKDDKGNTDLIDTQYLIFNLVAVVFVLGAFAHDPSAGLPPFPTILAILTGASAGTYVSNKAAVSDPPSLTGVVPLRGAVGAPVKILGHNLLVPASLETDEEHGDDTTTTGDGENVYREVYVMFGGAKAEPIGLRKEGRRLVDDDSDADHAPDHSKSGDDEIWVNVPKLPTGRVKVTVRTFSGKAADGKEDFEVAPGSARSA